MLLSNVALTASTGRTYQPALAARRRLSGGCEACPVVEVTEVPTTL